MMNLSRIQYQQRRVPVITDYPIKLELGCGDERHRHPDRKKGWIGVDIVDYGQEAVWDAEEGLPFPDKSVSEIYSSHTFEHLDDLIGVMNECWRVLVDDGILQLVVPHRDSEKALVPTHTRMFDKYMFAFFEYGNVERDYSVKPWKIIDLIVNERPDIHVKMTPDRSANEKA